MVQKSGQIASVVDFSSYNKGQKSGPNDSVGSYFTIYGQKIGQSYTVVNC